MQTYLVRRVGIAANAAELDASLTRLRDGEDPQYGLEAKWLRSYALREPNGRFGLICIFLADKASTLLEHAKHILLPATEVSAVSQTLQSRPFAPAQAMLVRRRACWRSQTEADTASDLPRRALREETAHGVEWMHSYVVEELGGTRGTWCLYRTADVHALLAHAASAGLPVDQVLPVLGRIVFRDEPSARLLPRPTRPQRPTPPPGDRP